MSPADEALAIVIHEDPTADPAANPAMELDRAKSATESATQSQGAAGESTAVVFREWIKAEPTGDGHVLTWEVAKVGPDGKPGEALYGFQIRRKVGEKTYTCEGTVENRADLTKGEEVCASLREK